MSNDKSELSRQAEELGKTKASDHIANMVKATLNAVPFVGGSIASLIDDYIPESRQKRIEEFSKNLAGEMERLGESLDANYVKTDEFAYLFTRVYQDVTRDYQHEKLIAYRNILVNALRVDVDASIQERYLFLVEQLTPLHLRLFGVLADAQSPERVAVYPKENNAKDQLPLMLALVPDIPSEQFVPTMMDLAYQGLLETMVPLDMPVFSYGVLTPFGRGFHSFISTAQGRVSDE